MSRYFADASGTEIEDARGEDPRAEPVRVDTPGRPYRLKCDGRTIGRFSTLRKAQDEETRLHHLAMSQDRRITTAIETD